MPTKKNEAATVAEPAAEAAKPKAPRVKNVTMRVPAAVKRNLTRTTRRVTTQVKGDDVLSVGTCWGFNTRSIRFDGTAYFITDKNRVGKTAAGKPKVKRTTSRDMALDLVGNNLVRDAETMHAHLSA